MATSSVKDKVFVITGSAQGIGKAFAIRVLEEGAKVCLSDISLELGQKTLTDLRERFGEDKVCLVACDVTDRDMFINLLNEAEKFFNVDCIDVLVNNAGINTNFGWLKCMEVNIMGVMIGSELAMDRMRGKPEKGYQIINTGSMAGFGPGVSENMVGYSVSKAGVLALTRTMAADIATHGVINKCICPAWTDTAIVSSSIQKDGKIVEKHIEKFGGLMTPEYVAEGFYRLLTKSKNGTAMALLKGVPYMEVPDYNMPAIVSLALVARLVGKILNPEVVNKNHFIFVFSAIFFIFFLFIAWLF